MGRWIVEQTDWPAAVAVALAAVLALSEALGWISLDAQWK